MTDKEMFEDYFKELKALPGVSAKHREGKDKEEWIFSGTHPNALEVSLYWWKSEGSYVGLDVEGVDCGYWHTAEVETLDYHIDLAIAALKGEVAYNRSPVLRLEEACFKLGDSWHCTRTKGDHFYHYITTRKKLKQHKG
jgi:hypothetical protein